MVIGTDNRDGSIVKGDMALGVKGAYKNLAAVLVIFNKEAYLFSVARSTEISRYMNVCKNKHRFFNFSLQISYISNSLS